MDMTVTRADNDIAHVALDGRFDIQGAQEVDLAFVELATAAGP